MEVVAIFKPDMEERLVQLVTRVVLQRGYIFGELCHAYHAMMDDEVMNSKMRFGSNVTPADFKRHVDALRKSRREEPPPEWAPAPDHHSSGIEILNRLKQ